MNQKKIQYHAYLVVEIDPGMGIFPMVRRVTIASQPGHSMSVAPGNFSTVLETSGESFQAAHDLMLELIKRAPSMHWMLNWLEPGYEAHQKRYFFEETRRLLAPALTALEKYAACVVSGSSTTSEFPTTFSTISQAIIEAFREIILNFHLKYRP